MAENIEDIARASVNRIVTHGLTQHPLYHVWEGMKGRCYTKTSGAYHKYGALGIKVLEPWKSSFKSFYDDMSPAWRPGLSIERIDGKGHYCKDNCRWADAIEQNNNRSCSRFIEFNGKTLTVAQWSRILGFSKNCIAERLNDGWSIEDALTLPKGSRKPTR